jgi:hypothetical protein
VSWEATGKQRLMTSALLCGSSHLSNPPPPYLARSIRSRGWRAASSVAPGMTLRASGGEPSQLVDVVEEAEHALLEQRRGAFVVVGQAVVSEQVSIARVQE